MTIITLSHKLLKIILYVSVIVELCIFPSWANLGGCVMTFLCWLIFDTYFLKTRIINQYPFAFLMFLSMFFYRFLPLPTTLLEGKPITYGLQLPYHTFIGETLLFIVSAMAFKASFTRGRRNNLLKRLLKHGHFYDRLPASAVWAIGLVGLFASLYTSSQGSIEYGDIFGKLLRGLTFLGCTPLVLFFPKLYDNDKTPPGGMMKVLLIGYTALFILLGIAGNSRQGLIAPLALLALLYFLQLCSRNEPLTRRLSPVRILVAGIAVYLALGMLTDMSAAILHNRALRSKVAQRELLTKTMDTYENRDLLFSLKQQIEQERDKKLSNYQQGWTETYVNNFMLNRYCNIRITDQTLYYALRLSPEGRQTMQTHFLNQAILALPTPVLNFLGIRLNKDKFEYSRGDLLYATARGHSIFRGYRVTSHLGDGLATFGYGYFVIQFILFFLVFKLLNTLVYYTQTANVYSLFGLISLFTFLGMFRNANGCSDDLGYVIRGYWQDIILWGIVILFIHGILAFKRRISSE